MLESETERGKSYMIISIDKEKPFEKNPIPFHGKTLRKLGIDRNFINAINGVYEK